MVWDAGDFWLPGLGGVGEILGWTKGGIERTRNTGRRRAARAAWKTVLSSEAGWTAVPGNVEPDQRA